MTALVGCEDNNARMCEIKLLSRHIKPTTRIMNTNNSNYNYYTSNTLLKRQKNITTTTITTTKHQQISTIFIHVFRTLSTNKMHGQKQKQKKTQEYQRNPFPPNCLLEKKGSNYFFCCCFIFIFIVRRRVLVV